MCYHGDVQLCFSTFKPPLSYLWDAVCSKTLRGLSQCFATFGACVLVAERDLYSHVPANIKVVLNREVDELLRENKYRVVNLALRLYSVHSV